MAQAVKSCAVDSTVAAGREPSVAGVTVICPCPRSNIHPPPGTGVKATVSRPRPVERLHGVGVLDAHDGALLGADAQVNGPPLSLTGALTDLVAALPALVREEERWTPDADPHCLHAVDLTTW
ncbi:hypothetical protein ACFRCI_40775 [Streptomyces sp. NPDC056638]|uniref:hypothetical protein n=1 Tax=Streptomyces sp. NPDC056638 TaxID=3345887 RepID=UPI00369D7BF2